MSVAAPQIAPARPPRTKVSARTVFARVEVVPDPAAALEILRGFAPDAPGSFYQSEIFLQAWLENCAAQDRATPFFIVARDEAGAPVALLPLGLFRVGPLRVAQFLGGKHSNYNLGLFRKEENWSGRELRALLQEAARATAGGPHLYRLTNLPLRWRGGDNPLAKLDHQPAASRAYATRLPADGDAFLAGRLSADTRKKLRKKEKRLAGSATLRHMRAAGVDEKQKVLDAFFRQKSGRTGWRLSEAEAEARRRFFAALAAGEGGLELHALALDDKIIAVFGAGASGDRMQGLFISYDPDPEFAKSSPGEILLTRVLRDACARQFSAFDLGVGDARYKAAFCDEAETLVEALYAPTAAGRLALPVFSLAAHMKKAIKRRPRLLALARKFRRP